MDDIFKKQSTKFSLAARKYLENKISYEDFKKEHMHYELSKFHLSHYDVEKMRESIFSFKNMHFKLANEFEQELENLKELVERSKDTETVDFDDLFAVGSLHGLAKYSEHGNLLPHMPMLNMVKQVEEVVEEKKPEAEEEFLFEF